MPDKLQILKTATKTVAVINKEKTHSLFLIERVDKFCWKMGMENDVEKDDHEDCKTDVKY